MKNIHWNPPAINIFLKLMKSVAPHWPMTKISPEKKYKYFINFRAWLKKYLTILRIQQLISATLCVKSEKETRLTEEKVFQPLYKVFSPHSGGAVRLADRWRETDCQTRLIKPPGLRDIDWQQDNRESDRRNDKRAWSELMNEKIGKAWKNIAKKRN